MNESHANESHRQKVEQKTPDSKRSNLAELDVRLFQGGEGEQRLDGEHEGASGMLATFAFLAWVASIQYVYFLGSQ